MRTVVIKTISAALICYFPLRALTFKCEYCYVLPYNLMLNTYYVQCTICWATHLILLLIPFTDEKTHIWKKYITWPRLTVSKWQSQHSKRRSLMPGLPCLLTVLLSRNYITIIKNVGDTLSILGSRCVFPCGSRIAIFRYLVKTSRFFFFLPHFSLTSFGLQLTNFLTIPTMDNPQRNVFKLYIVIALVCFFSTRSWTWGLWI